MYIEIPRKNGKTELASAIGMYLLVGDNEEGAEIYSVAKDKKQAERSFKPAVKRIMKTPALKEELEIYHGIKRIVYPRGGGSFWQVLPGLAATAYGDNVSGVLVDELHIHPSSDLLDAVTQGMGARRQPLTILLTTAGRDRQSVCWTFHQRALRQMANPELDPTFLGIIYAADEKDDWKSEKVWKKANPSYPITPNRADMVADCKRATEDPSYVNTFKRFRLNIWTLLDSERFIPMHHWFACPKRNDLDAAGIPRGAPELLGEVCYGGIDLSSVQDLSAFALFFPPRVERPFPDLLLWHFCPQERILQRARKDQVPYDLWVRQGYLTATPGNAIDYDVIERVIFEAKRNYRIGAIGYDRLGATQIVQHLTEANVTMTPVGMGTTSMTAPMKELLKLVLLEQLRHGDNPVMNWQADNLVSVQNATGDIKPAKNASGDKIDGFTAAFCAIFCSMNFGDRPKKSIYQTRGATIVDGSTNVQESAVAK